MTTKNVNKLKEVPSSLTTVHDSFNMLSEEEDSKKETTHHSIIEESTWSLRTCQKKQKDEDVKLRDADEIKMDVFEEEMEKHKVKDEGNNDRSDRSNVILTIEEEEYVRW